jgi:hypothetical protein
VCKALQWILELVPSKHKKVLDGGSRADREPIDGISERKDHDTKAGASAGSLFWLSTAVIAQRAADNFKYTLGGLLTSGQFLFV